MTTKKAKNSKSIVIIGIHGFKGHNLLKRLESDAKYKRVVAIDIKRPDFTLKRARFYKLDLTSPLADHSLAEIFKKENCDTLIHTAFPITPPHNEEYAHEVIAIGTYYIMNACQEAGVRKVVMATTADVYGASPLNPNYLTEDMPPMGHLQSRFLGDKIDAEKQALKYQQRHPDRVVTILRPSTILGPSINSYKTRYLQRPVITSVLGFDPLLQFVHEEDVINALLKLIDEDHPGIYNLAGDGVLPLSRVAAICGKPNIRLPLMMFKSMVQVMWFLDLAPAPASHIDFLRYLCVVDNTKIKKTVGFTPRYRSKEALLSFVGADRLRQVNLIES